MNRVSHRLAVVVALACFGCGGAPADALDAGVGDAIVVPPRCLGPEVASLGTIGVPAQARGWSVHASGALTYDAPFSSGAGVATDLTGTIDSVNTTTSTIALGVPGGHVDIVLEPVEASWLEALPIGHEVALHFENGLVLRDAASGALLLAVAEGIDVRSPTLDVGGIQVASGGVRCVQVIPAGPPCPDSAVHLRSQLDATFTLGDASVTLSAGGPPARLESGSDAFEVVLVGSVVQGGITAENQQSCEAGLPGATFVAIGRAAR